MADNESLGENSNDGGSAPRLALGRDLVALGFILVLATVGLAIAYYRDAKDVVAVSAPIISMVGTLIGTVFGVQVAQNASTLKAASGNSTANGNPTEADF